MEWTGQNGGQAEVDVISGVLRGRERVRESARARKSWRGGLTSLGSREMKSR